MGIKILTDNYHVVVRCFDKKSAAGNSYKSYALAVGSKDSDGAWHNALLNCAFKKGVDIPDKSKIEIKNCFPVVNEYNDKSYITWMITDFDMIADSSQKSPDSSFVNVPEGALEETGWE